MSLDVTDYSFDSIHFDNYKYSYKNAGKTIHIKKDETFEIHSHKPDVENQHKPRYKWQYITIKQTYKALEDVEIKIFEGFVRFDKDKVVEKNEFL